jgi:hypothetical protein
VTIRSALLPFGGGPGSEPDGRFPAHLAPGLSFEPALNHLWRAQRTGLANAPSPAEACPELTQGSSV